MFAWYRYKTIKISTCTPKGRFSESRGGRSIVFSANKNEN